MADIITAEERSEWKRIVEEYDKPDTNVVLEDYAGLAIREFPRTLAALEAAEAEIERLKGMVGGWDAVAHVQRMDTANQRAEKAEAEVERLKAEIKALRSAKCEGCYMYGDVEYIRIHVTNGVLTLCRQCLDDVNRKNPALPAKDAEIARLRQELSDAADDLYVVETCEMVARLRAAAEGKGTGT